ncbi:MAG: hypothetical protein JWO64_1606, partial [Hyphomicrobiales bacterium]|nr:hypothetical protein [Hyphomicrobiales bacterium]
TRDARATTREEIGLLMGGSGADIVNTPHAH